jgi:hypothetical protein
MAPTEPSIYERITERLAPYLGGFNAQVWVKVVAERELGLPPDELTEAHVESVIEGLRPSLNTFMGRSTATELLAKIRREIS